MRGIENAEVRHERDRRLSKGQRKKLYYEVLCELDSIASGPYQVQIE